jgi:hypothetical protein
MEIGIEGDHFHIALYPEMISNQIVNVFSGYFPPDGITRTMMERVKNEAGDSYTVAGFSVSPEQSEVEIEQKRAKVIDQISRRLTSSRIEITNEVKIHIDHGAEGFFGIYRPTNTSR